MAEGLRRHYHRLPFTHIVRAEDEERDAKAMYGMIHQALRDMAVRRIGDAEWSALLRDAGYTQPLFIGVEYYSDETTMSLVHLLAAHLDQPLDLVLEDFGRVWINFAGASEYGRILRMAGDDLVSFFSSLDRMHASIRSSMPRAEMPSFELVAADDVMLQLRYRSKRKGLEPFVRGLLLAITERFGESATISYVCEDNGALFIIRRTAAHA